MPRFIPRRPATPVDDFKEGRMRGTHPGIGCTFRAVTSSLALNCSEAVVRGISHAGHFLNS
jgi:hypothetical protein